MQSEHVKLWFLIAISTLACFIYSLMLYSPFNQYIYTSIAKIILFLSAPLIYAIKGCGKFRDLFKIRGNKTAVKQAFILGLATFVFILIAYFFMQSLFEKQMVLDGLANEGITKSTYPYVFAHIVFVNAFLEEIFFRGFVFFTIMRLGFKRFAYIFSSILFSVYHIAMMNTWFSPQLFLICLIGLIAAGLLFNELDRRCESIAGGLFLHIGANLAINLIGLYMIYF